MKIERKGTKYDNANMSTPSFLGENRANSRLPKMKQSHSGCSDDVRRKYPSSLYPNHPPGSEVLFRISEMELTLIDRIRVICSSLFIIGSVVWVPALFVLAWKRWKQLLNESRASIDEIDVQKYINDGRLLSDEEINKLRIEYQQRLRKKATIFASIALACATLFIVPFSPHRTKKFGEWIQIRKWKFLSSWVKFVAMEVITDTDKKIDIRRAATKISNDGLQQNHDDISSSQSALHDDTFYNQSILAFVPHGIFPFGYGFAFLPYITQKVFGSMRPVVATATSLAPILRDFLIWCNKVDASSTSVENSLRNGNRLGINPGGIDEIFIGYPKPGTHPHTEYCIVRKGFLRMALKHGIPVYPIYCFGATKMFRRLQLPLLERISHYLRVSIVVFYGVLGLPIPYRQKLMYVIGNPIVPPTSRFNTDSVSTSSSIDENVLIEMHRQFCAELSRIFDRHKESYGWNHKTLEILTK